MEPLGITVGFFIGGTLIALAAFFAWRQQTTLAVLRFDDKLSHEQRRYLVKQCQRRLFGSLLLFILAGMLIGSLFLDFDPLRLAPDNAPLAEREIARKQAIRFLSFYVMAMLMLVLVMLVLAIIDFWATARHGLQQHKRLLQEHQEMLEAELMELRHRRSEMN